MTSYGNILLVEDDLSLASWISDYLQQKGYQVIHHSRGDTVLSAMSQLQVDIILLDLMLPGMNGLELCRLLRQHYHQPNGLHPAEPYSNCPESPPVIAALQSTRCQPGCVMTTESAPPVRRRVLSI